MRTSRSMCATVAALFGLSLFPLEILSTEDSGPFDAARVLPSAPPVLVEIEASMPKAHSPPPPKVPTPKPPPVRVPTPPIPNIGRAASEAAQRAAMRAQSAAAERTRVAAAAAAAKAQRPAKGPSVYAATKLQRQVAEARARAYMAALRRTEAKEDAEDAEENAYNDPDDTANRRLTKQETSQSQKSRTSPSTQSKKPPAKPPAKKPPVSQKDSKKKTPPKKKKKKKKKKPRKKRPRYIAVNTVKDKRASPKAKRVVMIFDTHAERIIGNNVYELESVPPLESTLKFETYSIAYVGDGVFTP